MQVVESCVCNNTKNNTKIKYKNIIYVVHLLDKKSISVDVNNNRPLYADVYIPVQGNVQTVGICFFPINLINMNTNNKDQILTTTKTDSAVSSAEMTTNQSPNETNATTEFIDDANIVTGTTEFRNTLPRDLYMTNSDTFIQDIKTFLAKPVVIKTGVFQSTDNASSFPDVVMPVALLANTIINDKIKGYYGMRATMVFRLIVNATRFQQGRYLMAFIHSGGANPNVNTSAQLKTDFHKNTITARTQLPHVEIDLNCDTTAELTIPFVSVFNHYPLQNRGVYGDIGSVHISPYSALNQASGSTTAGFTIYAHLEDVELIGAAYPQSGISDKEKKPVGKVTSVVANIKRFTDTLKNFPTLASYAEPASWVLDVTANAAKAVGWSKPRNENNTNRVVRDAVFGLCNADTLDNSKKQSLFSNNCVSVLPGFSGTDSDELALSNIATKMTALTNFSWGTASTQGTLLWSDGVTPISTVTLSTRTILGGVTVTDFTPLQFVATYFEQWRGSLTYRLKFVKTEFHSGRLAIAFFPSDTNLAGPTLSLDNSNYVQRAIIDVRECNEFTFTVPYISPTPFKPIDGTNSYIGTIAIYVIDPLVAPSTVVQSVTVLIEHCGGTDIEFAIPANVSMLPAMNVTPQSGTILRNDCSLGETFLGASNSIENTTINAEACIGERILSFRSLLKAFNLQSLNATPIAGNFFNVVPFGVPVYYNSLTNPYPSVTGDLYGMLSSIFLFSRGGVRLKVLTTSQSIGNPFVSYNYYPPINSGSFYSYAGLSDDNVEGNTQQITIRLSSASTIHHAYQNYFAEVEYPQYHSTHSRLSCDHMINLNIPYSFATTSNATRLGTSFFAKGQAVSATGVTLHRAGSDDVNFGRFISIGPVYAGVVRPL